MLLFAYNAEFLKRHVHTCMALYGVYKLISWHHAHGVQLPKLYSWHSVHVYLCMAVSFIYIFADMIEVSLQPRDCICPSKGYTCHLKLASEISWKTNTTSATDFLYTASGRYSERRINGFQVNFTHVLGMNNLVNFTSTLLVTDINLNATDITCEGLIGGMTANDTITLCIIGML